MIIWLNGYTLKPSPLFEASHEETGNAAVMRLCHDLGSVNSCRRDK